MCFTLEKLMIPGRTVPVSIYSAPQLPESFPLNAAELIEAPLRQEIEDGAGIGKDSHWRN